MAYIHYDVKKNGVAYASVYESNRVNGKVKTHRIETLGRVIDKERCIFKQNGKIFRFTVEEGRCEINESGSKEALPVGGEKLILDFGDGWFFNEFVKAQSFFRQFSDIFRKDSDTVLAIMAYRLLTCKCASCHAKAWYDGNFACIAFPKADMTSQNISRVLSKLGTERIQRRFFENYIAAVYGSSGTAGILIDSTGVPNATKMDITQISNHNGNINREVRVIYVIDRRTGLPIYFRYVPGNIVDVSTLVTTVSELEQYGVSVEQVILDAGYFSEANAKELMDNGIPFLTRLAPNRLLFKEAVSEGLNGLMSKEFAHRYGERLVFIRKFRKQLDGRSVCVYLCIDEDMYLMQHKKAFLAGIDNNKSVKETDEAVGNLGTFAFLSSTELPEKELLPFYYTRQQVEQVFDITKNYADLLPIRVQTRQAFAGHLLVSFMATLVSQQIQRMLLTMRSKKAKVFNADSIWLYLRNQKCKVFTKCIIPQEPRKEANAIYDIFKFEPPRKINLETAIL